MTRLDDELTRTAAEVRDAVERVEIPTIDDLRKRRSAAPMLAMAAAAVLVIAGLFAALPRFTETSDAPVVVTQPETVDDRSPDPDNRGLEPTPSATPTPPAPTPDTGDDPVQQAPVAMPIVGRLTAAGPGEFMTISPEVPAWNVDETRLLVYRTGAGEPGHVVVDTATREIVAEVALSPPDIEQLYWHPTDADRLVAFEGSELWAFDISQNTRTRLAAFDGCGPLDAGFPSAPAETGELVALCSGSHGLDLLVYRLDVNTSFRTTIPDNVRSVHVAPQGDFYLLAFDDGSIQALRTDLQPLRPIDTGGDNFTLVPTAAGGRIVAVQYGGDHVGSVVTYSPDGEGAGVLIGPDQGHEYPPSGTYLDGAQDRVVFATRGPVAGQLGGRIVFVDFRAGGDVIATIEHGSTGVHDYWSEVFVSLSPSGRYVAYSTDSGGDRVDVHLAEFPP